MRKIIILLLFVSSIFAKPNIAVTYGYMEDIIKQIAQDRVNIKRLANPKRDPHFITPRPSLIPKISRADLLIKNGAELEIGWLPPLLNKANNSTLEILDLSDYVNLIDVPKELTRDHGDIHAKGNPHFILSFDNVLLVSEAIKNSLVKLDISNKAFYEENYLNFTNEFKKRVKIWKSSLRSGLRVVEYHKTFDYFFKEFDMVLLATIEPVSGVAPSSSHILKLIDKLNNKGVDFIINDIYHSQRAAKLIASRTNSKMVILPQDVYALDEVNNIFELFDTIVNRLK